MALISKLPKAIVMIDDFQVPGRPDFEYDSQDINGKHADNNLDLISTALVPGRDKVIFPTYNGKSLRGYVVIFHNLNDELEKLKREDLISKNFFDYKLSR